MVELIAFKYSAGAATRTMPAYDDGSTPTLVTEKPPAVAMTQFGEEVAGTLTAQHDSSPCADRGQNVLVVRAAQTDANGSGAQEEMAHMIDTTGPESVACVLKVRGGADTYMKRDGKVGTAGKGALVSEDVSFTVAATQDQTLFAPVDFRHGEVGDGIDPTQTIQAKSSGGYSLNYQPGVTNGYVVRRLTPMECERLQGFPSVVTIGDGVLSSDDLIAIALANKDISVDFDTGKVFGLRGPGGVRMRKSRELGFLHPSGYIHINLSAGGQKKQVRAHRVVYTAAYGKIPNGMVVDHVNGVKNDNRLCNLQLLTPEDNSRKAKNDGAYDYLSDPSTNSRMVPFEIRTQIRYEHEDGLTYRQLAEKYGCSKSTVSNIIHEAEWTRVPYRGKPAEQCPDGPRYKALGNSMAVPVMRWIFERIDKVSKETGGSDG